RQLAPQCPAAHPVRPSVRNPVAPVRFDMNADDFRRVALSLPEAAEAAHMGHPDFRVSGKIFATLDYPADGWGVVKLTPEAQDGFIDDVSAACVPVKREGDR